MAAEKEKHAAAVIITKKQTKLLPPDGGWGWMIVVGTAISNIFNQVMLSLFGLLYGDAIEAMGHKTQGAALVLSTMLFVTNFSGPIAGAIVKLTSPRFVAVTGSFISTAGIFFSGFSTTLWHLTLSYGVLLGLGLGFIQNSTFVAINKYFKLKKSRAVGLAAVGTGVGQTMMPHLVRYLLENYGFQGACLILSALSLNGVAGTYLLQPVEWHMKKVEEDIIVDESMHLLEDKPKVIIISHPENGSTHNSGRRATEPAIVKEKKKVAYHFSSQYDLYKTNSSNDIKNGFPSKNGAKRPSFAVRVHQTLWKKLYDLFDISLLSSPRFLNVIIGTSLLVSSVQNFSMLFPFFLQKAAKMDKTQTATCMSAVAAADIVGRLFLPMLQDKYHIKARWMLILTSTWVLIVRQILAYQVDLTVMMAMSCLYGVGRSMIIVARNIAIAENCSMEQVPAAVGLGMLSMGIIVPPAYYLLGWIRDYTGSYILCITAQNVILVIVLVTWLPDMFLLWREEKKLKRNETEDISLT